MGSKAFESMKAGLEEALADARGEIQARVHVPTPDPAAIRARLGLSQTEFATLFGMSLSTVTKWEQGLRSPLGPAATLLRVIDAEPEMVVRVLRPAALKRSSTASKARKKAPARKRAR